MDMEKYLGLWRLRSRSKAFVSFFSVLIIFVVLSLMMLPGITETRQADCGLEEHSHSSECYGVVKELACIYAQETIEAETVEETTAQETTCAEITTEEPIEQETTVQTIAVQDTSTQSSAHTHTDACYIYGNKIICTLAEHTHTDDCYYDSKKVMKEEETTGTTVQNVFTENESAESIFENKKDENGLTIVGFAGRPQEEKEAYILKVTEAFNALPTCEEIEEKIIEFEDNEDYKGEEEYLIQIKQQALEARQMYLVLDGYKDCIENSYKLFDLEFLWNTSVFTSTGEDISVEPYMVNYYSWSTVSDDNVAEPVIFYGGSGSSWGYTGFSYWMMIKVSVHEKGHLYVEEINTDISGSDDKSKYAPEEGGFILLLHDSDTENWANAQKVALYDVVTANFDYTTKTTYTNTPIGTLTFSTYVEPEPEEPGVEVETDLEWYKDTADASDRQVVDGGGQVVSADGKVTTTKTINGTSEENIFDITLTVQTQEDIEIFLSEPDMAVVVVMDISNTMNYKIGTINTQGTNTNSRYAAAVSAAEDFINQFAGVTNGLSKIGFVAFNTHAHQIFDLSPCSTEEQASALVSEMKSDTYSIIKSTGYGDSDDRFTNIEGGLKMGYDLLDKAGNKNKYIVFISDGFPTTYLKNAEDATNNTNSFYEGYYTTLKSAAGSPGEDGVFYDYYWNGGAYCHGTSYSDKAARKARAMATKIKADGTKIFSIGIDVGTQTVNGYINGLSVPIVDRDTLDYEIGKADDKTAFQKWLGSGIGSNSDGDELNYYFDSTAKDEIANAFKEIFNEIQNLNQQSTNTIWTTQDPMPVSEEEPAVVGFIHFYDKDGNPVYSVNDSIVDPETGEPVHPENIIGSHTEGGENDAHHSKNTIFWDLKNSGYEKTVIDNTTYYLYKLKYRVRLVNEKVSATNPSTENFVDSEIYETNGETFLEYRNVTTANGVSSFSESKKVNFSIPSVKGYLVPLKFTKVNNFGSVLPGAKFSLIHDDLLCTLCHGDGTAITDVDAHDANYYAHELHIHSEHVIGPYEAVSDSEGKVNFKEEIPSGHKYILLETGVPAGYLTSGSSYSVAAVYDTVTVTETLSDGTVKQWTGDGSDIITNITHQVLPETGGTGLTYLYIIGGLLISLSAVFLLCLYRIDRERRRKCSDK